MSESDIEAPGIQAPGFGTLGFEAPDLEAPGEDADEQARELAEEQTQVFAVPFDVNEADAVESARDVGYDDDDYR